MYICVDEYAFSLHARRYLLRHTLWRTVRVHRVGHARFWCSDACTTNVKLPGQRQLCFCPSGCFLEGFNSLSRHALSLSFAPRAVWLPLQHLRAKLSAAAHHWHIAVRGVADTALLVAQEA